MAWISRAALLACAVLTAGAVPAVAGGKAILVIGDSLSEEYAFMIDALGLGYGFTSPDSDPNQANTANWVEILALWRGPGSGGDYCSFGGYQNTYGSYADLRGGGYSSNFGVPGFTTLDWIDVLNSDSPLGDLLYYRTRNEVLDQLPYASAVVILLGGNDLKNDYDDVFNGTEPDRYYERIVNRILAIRNFLAARPGAPPVIVCTVPDVGVTAALAKYDDPKKRADARAKIAAMNDDLRIRAEAAGSEVADIHALTLRIEDEEPFRVNGTPFVKQGAPENPPDHLFCKDGFHPATVAHTFIANAIVAALNRALGTSIAPFADREILLRVPGLDPDQPFLDWVAGQGVAADGMHDNPDGDAYDNLAEFAFGTSAGNYDPAPGPLRYASGGPRVGLAWAENPQAAGYLRVSGECSPDLQQWLALDPADVEHLGGERWRAGIPVAGGAQFLRLRVDLEP